MLTWKSENVAWHLARLATLTSGTKRTEGIKRKLALVAIGGTFDALHRGHRELLRKAFAVGRKVIIGITSDQFVRRLHKPHKVDPYATRERDLARLLSRWELRSRAEIVPLHDRYGPTIENPHIQALVVSRRTIKTAYEINSMRKTNGLKSLAIVPIELILAEDGRPISSTRIRRGRIDREGRLVE